jgi:triosephosphate isomerase
MQKKLIIANWKMHFNIHEASLLVHKLASIIKMHNDVEVVLAPSFLALPAISLQINHRQFKLAAQDCDWHDEGAYTGAVSATMLRGLVEYVIIGHSERRNVYHEYHSETRKKVQAAVRNGLKPVLCIGENAHEKADGETKHVIHDQIVSGLANLTTGDLKDLTIAYEPVWAIGTGNNSRPDDVEKIVGYIRRNIETLYGEKAAKRTKVLYGGSCNNYNAEVYLSLRGVDGLLVGGASLIAEEFASIVDVAHNVGKHNK